MKSRFKIWLPTAGLAFALVASCAGNDPPPTTLGDAGEPGTGGQPGSGTSGDGGAASENPIPCSCVSEGAAGAGISFCDAGMATLHDLCARVIAANDYMTLTLGVCESGTRLHHNVVYPATGPIPETEAPRNSDPEKMAVCIGSYLNPSSSLSWEDQVNNDLCFAEAVWDCEGSWNSDNCGGVPLQQSCSD